MAMGGKKRIAMTVWKMSGESRGTLKTGISPECRTHIQSVDFRIIGSLHSSNPQNCRHHINTGDDGMINRTNGDINSFAGDSSGWVWPRIQLREPVNHPQNAILSYPETVHSHEKYCHCRKRK